MPKTRQKKREQEQEKKIEQEQKEAEAEDFLHARERVKRSISKPSIQVNSLLKVTKPVVEDERRMQIQTELAAEQTRFEQLEARLDQVGEGLAEALRDVRVDIMEEQGSIKC